MAINTSKIGKYNRRIGIGLLTVLLLLLVGCIIDIVISIFGAWLFFLPLYFLILYEIGELVDNIIN